MPAPLWTNGHDGGVQAPALQTATSGGPRRRGTGPRPTHGNAPPCRCRRRQVRRTVRRRAAASSSGGRKPIAAPGQTTTAAGYRPPPYTRRRPAGHDGGVQAPALQTAPSGGPRRRGTGPRPTHGNVPPCRCRRRQVRRTVRRRAAASSSGGRKPIAAPGQTTTTAGYRPPPYRRRRPAGAGATRDRLANRGAVRLPSSRALSFRLSRPAPQGQHTNRRGRQPPFSAHRAAPSPGGATQCPPPRDIAVAAKSAEAARLAPQARPERRSKTAEPTEDFGTALPKGRGRR